MVEENMVTPCKKNNRVLIILLVSGMLIFTMTCISIAVSYYNTIQSVRLSVANQSMKAASFVASRLDASVYQTFLEHPVKDNEAFKRLEQQLAEARKQFGALYIYIAKIDEDLQGGRVMVAALPPDSKQTLQIGDPCFIGAEQISMISYLSSSVCNAGISVN